MKIGIITFHASFNYGSMLQAWALQTYLENLGHQVEIINYRSKYQKSIYYKPFDFSSKYSILSSFKRLLFYPSSLGPLNKKWHLFNDFLHSNLNITKEYNTLADLKNENFNYDLVITGSDQIWNTNAPDSGDAYFANFINSNIKKIAYAPSFGPYPEYIDANYIRTQLANYDAVSVREEKGRDFLLEKRICDNVEVVCDPTLLLEAKDYDKLIDSKPLIEGDYIFFYTALGKPFHYFNLVNELAEKLGVPVFTERSCYSPILKSFKHINYILDVGPLEFLNLIKNSVCVFGDSFHLQVFSILFKKNFYTLNGDKDSRTNTLLSKLRLTERIVSLDKTIEGITLNRINYDNMLQQLAIYKQTSIEFLKRNCNC